MGKIYVLFGKSATGKDTVFQRLKEKTGDMLKEAVEYTTRPMRDNEVNGREHFFVNEERLEELRSLGKVIECRVYSTKHGPWYYFNVDDGQIDLSHNNYIFISTLEAYCSIRDYFPKGSVVPLYIEVCDKTRLHRALMREDSQTEPKYAELCRRFLADDADYSEEKLAAAGVDRRFSNEDLEDCVEEIIKVLQNGD